MHSATEVMHAGHIQEGVDKSRPTDRLDWKRTRDFQENPGNAQGVDEQKALQRFTNFIEVGARTGTGEEQAAGALRGTSF